MLTKSFYLLFFTTILFSCGSNNDDQVIDIPPVENAWIEMEPFLGGNSTGASSFVINDELYVGTGYYFSDSFYKYSEETENWTSIADFPGLGRTEGIGFSVNGKGYVGLGYNCGSGTGTCDFNYFNDLWRYDPESNQWEQMADFPGTARSSATSFVINGKAYVTGGSSVDNNDLWEYDPILNSWTQKTTYPGRASRGLISFVINGKAYVGLGYSDGQWNDFWEYNPSNDTWTEKNNFPGSARLNAAAISFNNYGYLYGGESDEALPALYFSDMWKYNPSTDTWVMMETSYPGKGKAILISEVLGGKIIFGLGADEITYYDDFWSFNPN